MTGESDPRKKGQHTLRTLPTPEQAGMKLRRQPVRPTWKPLYADHEVRIESWSKFLSEAYWNVTLRE